MNSKEQKRSATSEKDTLPLEDLSCIANYIASREGLKPVPQADILGLGGPYDLPIITECVQGRLWVDRFYIAYSNARGDLHYVYIARSHIDEEFSAYRASERSRVDSVSMPGDIRAIFKRALKDMAANKEDIWFDDPEEINEVRRNNHAYQG